MSLMDESKLRLRNGRIMFRIRQQDGSFQEMSLPNTLENRLFVSWVQIHD